MKLVIAGKFDLAMEKELAKLNSYKYKKEVFVKSDLSNNEMSSIIAACYALILPSLYNGFASHALAAMQCQIPVIAMANSSTIEIAGDAALYADASDPYQIADQMKLIFKDELLRNRLIEASKLRAPLFSWDKTAAHLWRVIEETLSR